MRVSPRKAAAQIPAALAIALLFLSLVACSGGVSTSSSSAAEVGAAMNVKVSSPTLPSTKSKSRQVVKVPGRIDSTGTTDVRSALNKWLANRKPWTTVLFEAGGTYLLSGGLFISGPRGLILDGNGATLILSEDAGGSRDSSLIYLGKPYEESDRISEDVVIRNLRLIGNSTVPGTLVGAQEQQAGIQVWKSRRVQIHDVEISRVGGDGFRVQDSSDVYIHDNHVIDCGRNGVTIISGSRVAIEANQFEKCGYCTFDMEPNYAEEEITDVIFRDNVAGTWDNVFVAGVGEAGSSMDRIAITGNVVTEGSLLTIIGSPDVQRSRVEFSGNRSLVSADGPVLRFTNIEGLIIACNEQPLRSGELASVRDSSDVYLDSGRAC